MTLVRHNDPLSPHIYLTVLQTDQRHACRVQLCKYITGCCIITASEGPDPVDRNAPCPFPPTPEPQQPSTLLLISDELEHVSGEQIEDVGCLLSQQHLNSSRSSLGFSEFGYLVFFCHSSI